VIRGLLSLVAVVLTLGLAACGGDGEIAREGRTAAEVEASLAPDVVAECKGFGERNTDLEAPAGPDDWTWFDCRITGLPCTSPYKDRCRSAERFGLYVGQHLVMPAPDFELDAEDRGP
jgi:hypothetical protein